MLRNRSRRSVVVPRPGRGTGQGGHGVAHELGGTGGDLGVEVALGVEDAHLAELVPDALDPLVHGRAGVAAEADGHGLEVDDKAPLVVRGDQGRAAREQQIVSIKLSRHFTLYVVGISVIVEAVKPPSDIVSCDSSS